MRIVLKSNRKEIEFTDGVETVNQNDVMWQVMHIELENPLSPRESLWIMYQHDEQSLSSTHEVLLAEDGSGAYEGLIPDEVVKIVGTWKFQLFIREISTTSNSFVSRAASTVVTFEVASGLPIDDSGGLVTNETIAALYSQAKKSVQSAEESAKSIAASAETITQNAKDIAELQTLPLEKGEGTDSVVQKYSGEVDETHYGNTNTGESAVVFGEANNNSANRALLAGKLNENSGANSIVGGLSNKNTGVQSIVSGGYNTNNGKYNSVAGQAHTVDAHNSLVGGTNNTLTDTAESNIVGGRANTVTHTCSSTVGTKNTNNSYTGIVGGSENEANGDAQLMTGIGNISHLNGPGRIVGGFWNNPKANTLLELGNGVRGGERSNAFEVYKDGRAKVYGVPTEDEDVVRLKELKEEISTINQMSFERVEALPEVGETTKIYLLNADGASPNVYEEWIYTAGAWEQIGTTAIDLSGYAKKSEVVDLTSAQNIDGYKMFANGLNIGYVFDFTAAGLTHILNLSTLKIPTEFFEEGYNETIATQEWTKEITNGHEERLTELETNGGFKIVRF